MCDSCGGASAPELTPGPLAKGHLCWGRPCGGDSSGGGAGVSHSSRGVSGKAVQEGIDPNQTGIQRQADGQYHTVNIATGEVGPAVKALPDAVLPEAVDVAYQPLQKGADERRYTLGVAFAADRPEHAKALDGKRDVIKADAIEDAAWGFLQKGRQIGLWHNDGMLEKGTVVESYIWRAEPWTLTASDGSQQTVKKGDWLLGVVWTPGAWALLQAGLINGLSPQGSAMRRAAIED